MAELSVHAFGAKGRIVGADGEDGFAVRGVEHRQGQRMHGGGEALHRAVRQHGAKRRRPVNGEVAASAAEKHGAGGCSVSAEPALPSASAFFAFMSSGRMRPRQNDELAAVIDADDGPCPRLLPVAPHIVRL